MADEEAKSVNEVRQALGSLQPRPSAQQKVWLRSEELREGRRGKIDTHPRRWRGQALAAGIAIAAFAVAVPVVISHRPGSPPTTNGPITVNGKLVAALVPVARNAVQDALTRCAETLAGNPVNCPQSITGNSISASTRVAWKAIGDQTSSFDAGLDRAGSLSATGHFQMVGSTSDVSPQNAFLISAGFYSVPLRWDGHEFSVGGFSSPEESPILARPQAAADKLALAATHELLSKCAEIHGGSSAPTCPQSAYDPNTARLCGAMPPVTWTLPVDPTATAVVDYNPATGIYKVSGTYTYHYDFEGWNAAFCPAGHQSGDTSGRFVTQLLWDGRSFVVGVPYWS